MNSQRSVPGTCCPKGTFCHDPNTQACISLRGTCDAGDNFCADGTDETRCGGSLSCFCYQTFGKQTRCGNQITLCGTCSQDSECLALFGAGSFCVKPQVEQSAFCGNCGAKEGFCAQPCLT
jgi:hypothetical protein